MWITIGVSLLGSSGCQTAGLGSGRRAPSSASWRVPVAPVRSAAPQGGETALPGPIAIPEVEVEEVDRILYVLREDRPGTPGGDRFVD